MSEPKEVCRCFPEPDPLAIGGLDAKPSEEVNNPACPIHGANYQAPKEE